MRLLVRAAVAAAIVLATPQAASASLQLGFVEQAALSGADSTIWTQRMQDAGAQIVRITASWRDVAPRRPASPTDPADPAYAWMSVDRKVAAARAGGLRVLLSIGSAPAWAEGDNRPRTAAPGSWKPDPAALERFATAVARRYDGQVSVYGVWNEPNLPIYLSPQWSGKREVAPAHYRKLVNAVADGVHAVAPKATIVAGFLAPFGDYAPGGRIPPAQFLRSMLCLDDRLRKACSARTDFDVLSHHPYSARGPQAKALNPDDVSVLEMSRLTRPLRAAERLKTVTGGRKPLWITEFSWDSAPPDPDGVPTARLLRWTGLALEAFERQGVSALTWYLFRDHEPKPSYAATSQSGLYTVNGDAKPLASFFRIPLNVQRVDSRRARVWMLPAVDGRLQVQVRRNGRWSTAKAITGKATRPSVVRVSARKGTAVRVVQGERVSVTLTG